MKKFSNFVSENVSKNKSTKYSVLHYDAPNSGRVVNSTIIHAANKAELHGHVRNWMDKIGLDPDDEDDHSHINIIAK